jgi:hypothetical protein
MPLLVEPAENQLHGGAGVEARQVDAEERRSAHQVVHGDWGLHPGSLAHVRLGPSPPHSA